MAVNLEQLFNTRRIAASVQRNVLDLCMHRGGTMLIAGSSVPPPSTEVSGSFSGSLKHFDW